MTYIFRFNPVTYSNNIQLRTKKHAVCIFFLPYIEGFPEVPPGMALYHNEQMKKDVKYEFFADLVLELVHILRHPRRGVGGYSLLNFLPNMFRATMWSP